MARQEKLVLTIAANGKVAQKELKDLDAAIKRIAGGADAAAQEMQDLQKAAKKAASDAAKAGKAQQKAAEAATVATKALAEAQKSVSAAAKAAAKAREAAEKKVQKTIEAANKKQLADIKRLEEAKKRAAEVKEATKGSRSQADIEARKVAAEEVKAAQAALKAKQAAAALALAAVKKEAAERKKMADDALKAAKEEARIRAQAAKAAARAQQTAARETQRRLSEAGRSVQNARNLAGRIEARNDPTQAMRRLGVSRDDDVNKRVAEIEAARQAALRAENLSAKERIRINQAADRHIARERARLETQTLSESTRALNELGMRKKAQIQEEIAKVKERERIALSSAGISAGQRLAIERRTVEQIRRLNRELADATATRFQQRMREAANAVRGMAESARTGAMNAAMYVGAPSALAVRSVAKTAGNYEEQRQKVRALLRFEDDENFARLEEKVRRDSENSKIAGAKERMFVAETLASQGLNLNQIYDGGLDAAILAATATGGDFEEAANLMVQAANIFGVKADKLPDLADQLAGLTDVSKFDVNEVSLAFAQGASVAQSAGLDETDYLTMIALMSKEFKSGSDAGTSAKTYMQSLVKDTPRATEAFKALGFDPFYNEDQTLADGTKVKKGQAKSIREQAVVLNRGITGMSQEDALKYFTQLFGTDAARAALVVAKAGGQGFDTARTGIMNGDAQASADIRKTGFNAEMKELKSALEELQIAVGESGLIDWLTWLVNKATEFVQWLSKVNPTILAIGSAFNLLGIVVAPVLLAFWGVTKVLTLLGSTGRVGAGVMKFFKAVGGFFVGIASWAARGVTAIMAIVAAFLGLPLWVTVALSALLILLVSAIVRWRSEIWAGLKWAFETSFNWCREKWDALMDFCANALRTAFEGSFNWAKGKWDAMIDFFANGLKRLYEDSWLQKGIRIVVGDETEGAAEEKPQGFSRGGMVRGRGTSISDSVPAMLSDGEGVIRARAMRFFGGESFLNGINNLDPRAVVVPRAVAIPAAGGGGGRDLHPLALTINGGDTVHGVYATPSAAKQLHDQQNRLAKLRPAALSRSEK